MSRLSTSDSDVRGEVHGNGRDNPLPRAPTALFDETVSFMQAATWTHLPARPLMRVIEDHLAVRLA
jgi:hypothetical protein